jgi:hypothetical protein
MVERRHIAGSRHSDQGVGRLSLAIGGITMAVIAEDPELKLRVEGAMQKFLVDEARPEVSIRAAWGDLSAESGGERLFDSGALWQLYRQQMSYLFRFASPRFGSLPYKVASFNRDFTTGEVALHRHYFTHDRAVYPLEYPLDELLVMNLLSRGRGAEIHSCGVVDQAGSGYLFVGQSGAGKTTMAGLWQTEPGARILSDDRVILRYEGGRLWMYGTPWHGEAALASPDRAPVSGIFFLHHGQKNELAPMKRAEAAARLFACSFPTFYCPSGLDFTLELLAEVTADTACQELRFLPDRSVVEFLRRQAEQM